jgi:nucleoside-diphosphate-sugar epimerase
MATILVIGATRTVGSEVIKQLSSSGQHVLGTVHFTTTAAFSKDKFKEWNL